MSIRFRIETFGFSEKLRELNVVYTHALYEQHEGLFAICPIIPLFCRYASLSSAQVAICNIHVGILGKHSDFVTIAQAKEAFHTTYEEFFGDYEWGKFQIFDTSFTY